MDSIRAFGQGFRRSKGLVRGLKSVIEMSTWERTRWNMDGGG
jgi:hypothetical protein